MNEHQAHGFAYTKACPFGDHSNHASRIDRSENDIQALFEKHSVLERLVVSVIIKVSTIVGVGTGVSIAATFMIQFYFKG